MQKAQIMGKILQLEYNAIENVFSLKDTKCLVVSWTESWNQEDKSYEIKKKSKAYSLISSSITMLVSKSRKMYHNRGK